MKNIIIIFALGVLSWAASPVSAGEFSDLTSGLNEARNSLATMVSNKDQRGAVQQKLVKDTADAVSASLAKMKAPSGKEGMFKELVDTWKAFRETRDKELVPALLQGEEEKAETILWGIQKERYGKCLYLIRELDQNDAASMTNGRGFDELSLRLSEARMSLLVMMREHDKRGADQQKLVKDSADAVSNQLLDIKPPAGKEGKFKELVETWNAFKETREKELVPAILKGDEVQAKKLMYGIQKERMTKFLSLTREIDGRKIVAQSKNAGAIE